MAVRLDSLKKWVKFRPKDSQRMNLEHWILSNNQDATDFLKKNREFFNGFQQNITDIFDI